MEGWCNISDRLSLNLKLIDWHLGFFGHRADKDGADDGGDAQVHACLMKLAWPESLIIDRYDRHYQDHDGVCYDHWLPLYASSSRLTIVLRPKLCD